MSTMRVLVFLLLSMSMSSLIHGTFGGVVGGYQPIKDLTDPHIVDIAKFAVSKHNKDSQSNLIFQMIVSGEYQVVAGTNYVLIIEVKDGAKLSRYETKVFKPLKGNLELKSFEKLSVIPGGYQPIENLTDPHIVDIAKFAVSKHNKDSQSNFILQRIVSGEYQVVAGTNYVFIIEVKDGAKLSRYETKVFKPLKGNLELKSFEKLSGIVGGYQPIENLTDPRIVHIAKFAVSKHNKDTHSNLIFQNTVSGESQVVAGTNYILIINAKDGTKLSHYEAKVFESLKGDLTLIYFKLAPLEKKKKLPVSEWKPVENLEKDMHILDIARNAVLEHNKELAKDDDVLVFEKVVSGETQEVDHEGVKKYRLVISANGAKYEALVWEKVTSFKPLP